MEKETLEAIVQRLDQLEKMITEVNQQLSWIVEELELVPDAPKDCEHTGAVRVLSGESNKQDAHRAKEALDRIFEKMGIPSDFDPGSIEELQESMRQHGIRAEDNEFSRAIIAEREK